VTPDDNTDKRDTSTDLIDKIEKTWNRLKIARSAGRRDFQTYEFVLYESLNALRALLIDHEHRLKQIEQQSDKG
jgi:hypothetical protein